MKLRHYALASCCVLGSLLAAPAPAGSTALTAGAGIFASLVLLELKLLVLLAAFLRLMYAFSLIKCGILLFCLCSGVTGDSFTGR